MSLPHCHEHLILRIALFGFGAVHKAVGSHLCDELRVIGKFYLCVFVS